MLILKENYYIEISQILGFRLIVNLGGGGAGSRINSQLPSELVQFYVDEWYRNRGKASQIISCNSHHYHSESSRKCLVNVYRSPIWTNPPHL